jgi:hypothetical protein
MAHLDFQPSHKIFWRKFTHSFLLARPFYNVSNSCCIAMERPSLQKELVNLRQKKFNEIDSLFA